MGRVRFTDEQQQVIDFEGNNLLVSAGAGSGKTTVMIERVAKLIQEKQIPISRFLIISFTKASAGDMKAKLIKKLSAIEPTPFILEQLDDILTSDVSNLHSFCARMLKAYFYEVGLDPTFMVLDQVEVDALKEKALTKLFNKKTESGDKAFYALVDIFSKSRKDTGLKKVILKLYDFLCSITNSDEWFKNKIETLYDSNLNNNAGAKLLNAHMKAERSRLEKKIQEMMNLCEGQQDLIKYLQALDSKVKVISYSSEFKENANRLISIERLPNIPKATETNGFMREKVVALKDDVNERFKKLKEYALVDEFEDIETNLIKTKQNILDLFALEQEFEKVFSDLKKEKGGLDFNDLEKYTLKVLSNQTLLDQIKEKYDYILVDEYQDINGVQEEILKLVSKENNRFMVGDVKQSIYRFRLCDPEIFLDKYNLYQKDQTTGYLIRLNHNFRSKKTILDFINSIFDVSMTEEFGGVDYKKEARLNAGSDSQKDEETRVGFMYADTSMLSMKEDKDAEVYSVRNALEDNQTLEKQGQAEGLMIAGQIANLMANKQVVDSETGKLRNIRFSDITILALSRTAVLSKIVETLQKKGIPVSTDIEGDVFDDEYVFGIRSFIETIACFKDDYSLFKCMYSKLFEFSANELAQIKICSNSNDFFYKDVLEASRSESIDAGLKTKLVEFLEIIEEFRTKAGYLSTREIAQQISALKQVELKIGFEKDSENHMQKYIKFMSTLGDQNVYDYLNNTALAEVKSQPVFSGGAVKVMTIHKSKGLEFKVVFLVNVSREFNFSTIRSDIVISKDLGVCMDFYDREQRYKTPTLARQAVKLIETRKLLEEQQRLLYVALTRATDYLYIVGSGDQEKVKTEIPASPVCFLDFMGDLMINANNYQNLKYEVFMFDAKDLLEADTKQVSRNVVISQGVEELEEKMKSVINFKYTHKTVDVPVKTAVTRLVKDIQEDNGKVELFSDRVESSAEKGTLNHLVMSKLDLSLKSLEDIKTQIDGLVEKGVIEASDIEDIEVEGIYKLLNNKDFINLIEGAQKIYQEKEFYTQVDASLLNQEETKDKIIVQGIIDLLIISNKGLIIVDYKTGSLSNEKVVQDYYEQIGIYAKAMEKAFNIKIYKKCLASLKNGKLIVAE